MNVSATKFKPADFIACAVIVGGLGLIYLGKNGVVGGLLTAVVAFYFGEKVVQNKLEKKNPDEDIDATIRRIANANGVDPGLAVRVARCESSLNPDATNTNTNGSIDRGVFQWNDKWHPEISDVCAFDVECATKKFCEAVKGGHLSWWNATKKCWKLV